MYFWSLYTHYLNKYSLIPCWFPLVNVFLFHFCSIQCACFFSLFHSDCMNDGWLERSAQNSSSFRKRCPKEKEICRTEKERRGNPRWNPKTHIIFYCGETPRRTLFIALFKIMRLKKNCRLAHLILPHRWGTMSQINKYKFDFDNIDVSSLHFYFRIRLVCPGLT